MQYLDWDQHYFSGIVSFALLDLYYIGFGLDPFWVGTAQAFGYVSIPLSQFFFGWISDYFPTKIGRRKPWIALLTPIEVIAFICLLMPQIFLQNPNHNTLMAWLFIWDILFEMAYAGSTPYGAWMAEIFTENERPKVAQTQNIFGFLGNGAMAVFTVIIFS